MEARLSRWDFPVEITLTVRAKLVVCEEIDIPVEPVPSPVMVILTVPGLPIASIAKVGSVWKGATEIVIVVLLMSVMIKEIMAPVAEVMCVSEIDGGMFFWWGSDR